MNILDARTKLAAALAPIAETDPTVHDTLVDAVDPPALIVGWGEPWLEPDTVCIDNANLVVTAVAHRLMPGEGIAELEQLVDYTKRRIAAAGGWPRPTVSGPRAFTIAKTNYLAARITLRVKITGGP